MITLRGNLRRDAYMRMAYVSYVLEQRHASPGPGRSYARRIARLGLLGPRR